MNERVRAYALVLVLLLSTCVPLWTVAASTNFSTTISFQENVYGDESDGGSVFSPANPTFQLAVSNLTNATIINTEYELSNSTSVQLYNYTTNVTIPSNHSSTFDLRYRTNTTSGLESWKSLEIVVDADSPVISLSSTNGSLNRYSQNQSIFVVSSNQPLEFQCVDSSSGVQSFSGLIGNTSLASINNSITVTNQTFTNQANQSQQIDLTAFCSDNVGNNKSSTFTLILDDENPQLLTTESGTRIGNCVSEVWKLWPSATDNHSAASVQIWSQFSWSTAPSSISPDSNTSGSNITLRAVDSSGFSSSNQSWLVTVDSSSPNMSTTLNSTELSISAYDNCTSTNVQVMWETILGQSSGWATYQNSTLVIPVPFNGSIVRAKIKAIDQFGNENLVTSGWVSTNGSLPSSVVVLQNDHLGNISNNSVSLRITPTGYLANSSFQLYINSQLNYSSYTTSQVILNRSLAHGDDFTLLINTSNGYGGYTNQNFGYTVDNSNGHVLPITLSGQSLNTTSLLLGPTGRLTPAAASDDNSGVGGDFVSCTWDASTWFQSTAGFNYAPSTSSGSVQAFVFGCRSVDYLGNEGPITWVNGSVDLETPSLTLQPAASETIGLNTSLVVNASDSNGIASTQLNLEWSNGSSTLYSNLSLGTSNWTSTLGQLFTGLSDGTVTATVVTTDQLGNTNTISSRSWTLNTSSPFITTALSGTYYNQFITNDSTGITLTLPSGGWSGLWVAYTFVDSSGSTILSGNVSSSTLLEPADLVEGTAWLNTTTGDALGRIQVQSWIYTVDNSNGQSPVLNYHGANTTVLGVIWIGGSTFFTASSVSDDSNGVGGDSASCTWDNQTWFTVSASESIYPSITYGTLQNLTLECRNVDHLGNVGPLISVSVKSDTVLPTQEWSPTSGSYISPNSSIDVITTDNLDVENRLHIVWTNETTTLQSNITMYMSTNSITLNQIWANLADGVVQSTLYSVDEVGNMNQSSTRTWYLNTTMPSTLVHLQGNFVGTYVPSHNFAIQLVPPTVGNSNGWAVYTLEHSNGSTILSGNISNSTQLSFCQSCSVPYLLTYGVLYLNISSFDYLNRSQSNSWVFTVDDGVGTIPSYSLTGPSLNQTMGLVLGPEARINFATLQDDVGGVGVSHARCSLNGNPAFNVSSGSSIDPNSTSGAINSFSLGCSVVDYLGYIGSVSWINGSVDAQTPWVNFSIVNNAVVSQNTTLSIVCVDTNGCNMVDIYAKFQQGTNVTWFGMTLSGPSASIQLSSFLTVSGSGYLEIYVVADDGVGNNVNSSLNGLLYLHDTPTLDTQILTVHSGSYVHRNLSLSFIPSTGWVTGLTVNLSMTHSNSTASLFSGQINQTSSIQNITSLPAGEMWVNTTICDAMNRCSNSTSLLLVDASGPGLVNLSGNGIHYLPNGSAIMSGIRSLSIAAGNDSSSGTATTYCSGVNGYAQFSTPSYLVGVQSIVTAGDWEAITCYSIDHVGNIGQSTQLLVFIDNDLPIMSTDYGQIGGVITPDKWFNGSCNDAVLIDSSTLRIWNGSNLIYQNNGTSGILLRYGLIPSFNSNMNLRVDFSCVDAAGNQNITQQQFEFVFSLNSTTILIQGITHNSNIYVKNSTVLSLNNDRSDISHMYRYIVNGTGGTWLYTNQSSIAMNLSMVPDSSLLRVQVRVYLVDSNLSNSSLSPVVIVDNNGPVIQLQSNLPLANGSKIDLTAADSGVGVSHFVWSWDNGTIQQNTDLSVVIIPNSLSNQSWLEIRAVDALGHSSETLAVTIHRDVTLPIITFNNSHGSFFGPNSMNQVFLSDDTGIAASSVILIATSTQNQTLSVNVTNFVLSSTTVPIWIWNYSSVELRATVLSNSGHTVTKSLFIHPDNAGPSVSIDFANSKNISAFNSSNNSEILLSIPSDLSDLCIKAGVNESQARTNNCLNVTNSIFQVNRDQGPYVLLMNGSDFAGNTRQTVMNMNHHSDPPAITISFSSILLPGSNHSIGTNNQFTPRVEVLWDNNSLVTNQSYFITPAGSGEHYLTIRVTNDLGLVAELNRTIVLDGAHPTLSIETNLYGGAHFGSNSTVYINASDELSLISNLSIFVNYSGVSCGKYYSPLIQNFSVSGIFSTLMSSTACANLQTAGQVLTIEAYSEDSTGNYFTLTRNYTYHGSVRAPEWITSNTVHGLDFVWSGMLSNHTCSASPGSIAPSYNLLWSGSGGSVQNNTATNISSSGIFVCTVFDMFGNNASTSLNVSYDSSSPEFNIVWPASSSLQFVKSNTGYFSIQAFDNSTGVQSIQYCISITTCTPNLSTNGTIYSPPGAGSHSLYLELQNGVGLVTTHNLTFIVDNALPTLSVSGEANSSINGSSIFIGGISPVLRIEMQDSDCILGGFAKWGGNSIALSANTSLAVPQNSTWVEIQAVDCVGHVRTNNYSIQKVYSVNTGSLLIQQNHLNSTVMLGTTILHDGSLQMLLNVTHPVPLIVECVAQLGVVCTIDSSSQPILVTINTTSSLVIVQLAMYDGLGNYATKEISLTADVVGGYCSVVSGAYIETDALVLRSNRNSTFVCFDDIAGIHSVSWKQGQTITPWSNDVNQTWVAPAISGPQVELVIKDRVGNIRSTQFNLTSDDQAPELTITSVGTGVSLEEGMSRSDGQIHVSCSDLILQNCSIIITVTDQVSGELLLTISQNNEINLTMPLPNTNTTVRVGIGTWDILQNQDYASVLLTIDDQSPSFNFSSYSASNVLLSEFIASHDGSLRFIDLSADYNFTMSGNLHLKCVELSKEYQVPIKTAILLADYDLVGCENIVVTANISDHVGNSFGKTQTFALDQKSPIVTYSLDSNCSIDFGTVIDLMSNCEVDINIDDDEGIMLLGNYDLIFMSSDNTTNITQNIGGLKDSFTLENFRGKTVIVGVVGRDNVGNIVASNFLTFSVSDEVNPIWDGVICEGNVACDMATDVTMAPTGEIISIRTPQYRAGIASVNLSFASANGEFSLTTTSFSSSDIEEGTYLMTVSITDEIGRVYTTLSSQVTYDTSAPVIEILDIASTGLLNEVSILSCSTCELVWRVNDLTNITLSTNHGTEEFDSGQYAMITDLLGNNEINITAMDSFGRSSTISYQTLSILTTRVDLVKSHIEYDNMHVQCIEIEPINSVRQVKCLWARKSPSVSTIPVAFDIEIDLEDLRDVQLIIKREGASSEVIDISSGRLVLPNIYAYDTDFELVLSDQFSQINSIHVSLIEHTSAWSDLVILTSDVGEDHSSSELSIMLSPSVTEGNFYLFERGFASIEEFISCSVNYEFNQYDVQSLNLQSNSCEVIPGEFLFLANGSLKFAININHSLIRNQSEKLHPHQAQLFNLDTLQVTLSYQDYMGLSQKSQSNELEIRADSIYRIDDNEPTFNESMSNLCPLSFSDRIEKTSDGFLQSQDTSPLSECHNLITDKDGVYEIVWRITFTAAESKRVVEVHCMGTYFPQEWDIESAIPDTCRRPDQQFPDGVFDVKVEPVIVDHAMYNRDSAEFQKLSSGAYGRFITEDCGDAFVCERLSFSLEAVTVSSDLDPAEEVQNTKKLIQTAQATTDTSLFKFMFVVVLCGFVGAGAALARLLRNRRDQYLSDLKENSESQESTEQNYGYNLAKLDAIVKRNNIRDVVAFIEFAKSFDINNDAYLSGLELSDAAAKYTEVVKENVEITSESPGTEEVDSVDGAK